MTNTDALTWPEPAPSLARAVAGEFRLVREIGRGGMGVVYLARDTRLDRDVAIKTLPPHLAADAQVRERFVREARTAAALSHPNIVPIHAAAERDGVVYFVMGYVNGRSLADCVAGDGPLSVPDALRVVRQGAQGLDAAHARGVVHRDIKAENVLLDAAGQAHITDFGIARVAEVQPLTATGTVLGSVHYMSPEQVTGEAIDGRSDLYALGVLWYFLLSARFPFERPTSSAILVAHVNSRPTPLRELAAQVPETVAALVMQLLEKPANARPGDARVLLEAIAQLPAEVWTTPPSDVAPGVASGLASGVAPHAPLSSTEAQAVWARAAELQAYTGVQAPPPEALRRRPPTSAPLTSGYDAALVKAAAEEAGIDARYVERALSERAQVERAPSTVVIERGEKQQSRPNLFLGAHTKLDFHATIPREVDVALFEEIADDVREVMGEMVTVSAVGRTLTVMTNVLRPGQSGIPRAAQIQVLVRNGRTTVRAFEDVSQLAGGLFGGLGGGAGGGLGAMIMGLTIKAQAPIPMALTAWVGTAAAALGLARILYVRQVRKKEQELLRVMERIVARVEGRSGTEAGPLRGASGPPAALPPGTSFQE
ncbi:serine/threonine-protein kinase [Gemmatimonas sp. UBA7669]|uniref:serine/threonine-protein kinase n=1 Tax=Gemmatimonas sp. UBA7669 TaxID=1946568 RepID=UPI0025BB7020|nr:serine/threonine-protein kinase [Gemmatimonas sp. UBA7669]